MEKIYYNPKGFWKGLPAVEKLSKEAKVSKQQALEFLRNRRCGRYICLHQRK